MIDPLSVHMNKFTRIEMINEIESIQKCNSFIYYKENDKRRLYLVPALDFFPKKLMKSFPSRVEVHIIENSSKG